MRQPTKIEESFTKACKENGIVFQTEKQIGRYRTDFLDPTRKLIIELDGHETHKSVEDRTYDAKRDRQLHRDGYTVLRFTGSEIYADVNQCITEIKQTLSLMEPQENPVGAIYIDWQFFDRKSTKTRYHYQKQYPDKKLKSASLSRLLDFLAERLKLRGKFDVHLFGTASSFSTSLTELDALKLFKSHNALFNVTEHQNEFLAIALVEHLHKQGTVYDNLTLIADDGAYPPLLTRGRVVDVLLRRDNDSTSMADVDANAWQDIDYVIGACIGLLPHEL